MQCIINGIIENLPINLSGSSKDRRRKLRNFERKCLELGIDITHLSYFKHKLFGNYVVCNKCGIYEKWNNVIHHIKCNESNKNIEILYEDDGK